MKRQIAAIEFGTSKIVTLIAQNSGVKKLDIVGSGTVPYDGYQDGEWNTPRQMIKRVQSAISAASMQAGTQIREIYVGVPGEFIHALSAEAEVEAEGGEITAETMAQVMDAAADQLQLEQTGCVVLHRSAAWYTVDGGTRTMAPEGKGGRLKGKISYIVAEPSFVEDVSEMMGALGITILGFVSTTLGEALLLLLPEERDRGALLIDAGYLNTEVSFMEGDAITYHAVIPQGGGHITRDLCEELHIPMRDAEKIKREYAFNPDDYDKDTFAEVVDDEGTRMTFPRDVISGIVERSVDELANMLDLCIQNDVAPLMGARSGVYLTGGAVAMMHGGKEYLSAKINRPMRIGVARTSDLNSPIYSSALGLADLTFDSIEQVDEDEGNVLGRVRGLFKRQ